MFLYDNCHLCFSAVYLYNLPVRLDKCSYFQCNKWRVTLQGKLLELKATIIGTSLTFNIQKSDGSVFQNNVTIQIRQNSATGTLLQSKDYGGGYSLIAYGYGDITFTGSRKFVVVLKSKGANNTDYWYYSSPVTITVEENPSENNLLNPIDYEQKEYIYRRHADIGILDDRGSDY